jgi:23S rRNA pseudouridine1911/1915/1917 synthase
MDNLIKVLVNEQGVGLRIDVYLSSTIATLSRAKVQKLLELGKVMLDGVVLKDRSYKLKLNQEILVENVQETTDIIPSDIPIEVLFEDDHLIIINKPAGLVVHPGAGNFENTLVNGLIHHYGEKLSTLNGNIRPGIVHRLDKNTSGVLVVAKDDHTHALLAKLFEKHDIVRAYRALVWGNLPKPSGSITTNIARSENNRQKMEVTQKKGKLAITHYKLLKNYENLISLVDLKLETGRTHQIRVHMAHLGNPVVADQVYGKTNNRFFKALPQQTQTLITGLNRQCLHAYKLGFVHPITKQYLVFETPEPKELQDVYRIFED